MYAYTRNTNAFLRDVEASNHHCACAGRNRKSSTVYKKGKWLVLSSSSLWFLLDLFRVSGFTVLGSIKYITKLFSVPLVANRCRRVGHRQRFSHHTVEYHREFIIDRPLHGIGVSLEWID